MNEATKVIKNRRSIRKYKAKQISDAEMDTIMDAAIYAPNAGNEQKWHFTVVQNEKLIDSMVDTIKENILNSSNPMLLERVKNPAYHTFYHAPAVIIITGHPSSKSIQLECGAAMQTIALAAESINIGTCPITSTAFLFQSDKGRTLIKQLGIPDEYNFVCSLAMGYPEGEKPATPPRKKEVVNFCK